MSSPAAEAPPRVYLLYGNDALAISEAVDALRSNPKLGDAALNLRRFEARELDFTDFEESAMMVPFLGERRLVLIEHIQQHSGGKEWTQKLLEILARLPPTTGVVITHILTDQELKRFASNSALMAWCGEHPQLCLARAFNKPTGSAFVGWLIQRAADLGGQLEPQAAQLLAEYLEEDTLKANLELEKLIAFVNSAKPITLLEVELLTPSYVQSGIFKVVDAIGARDAQAALRQLDVLLASEPPLRIFSMIARQFRLLLLAKELAGRGEEPAQALQKVPLKPRPIGAYEAGKLSRQAANFNDEHLRRVFQQLVALDRYSKLGRKDLATEIECLVALNS